MSLGRGGMGTVEVALEARPDGEDRIVALKRLLPEAKAHHAEMFLREARLAALLEHPNVVHAFDFGELDGELFMAMEYVEGEPLSRVLTVAREKGVALAPALVAGVLARVAEGLHAAHELKSTDGAPLRVVHRDVSPHNIMVSYDGQVKVVDFGVAKIDDQRGFTRTGEVKGKAAYMSPEQAMGDPLDRRSDLYSLGAVLFECLAGRRMWEGTDMEVMRKLALAEPPPLEAHSPNAPAPLIELYGKLVARSAEDRPPSGLAAAEVLGAVAGDDVGEALTALMATLFDDAGAARRAELERVAANAGAAHAVPSKSLPPGTTTPSRATAGPADRPSEARKPARVWLWAAAGTVVLAGVGAWRVRQSSADVATPTSTSTSTSNITGRSPEGTESSHVDGSARTLVTSTSTSTPTPTARSGGAALRSPGAVRSGAKAVTPAPSGPSPATPTPTPTPKALDVDPHAI